MTNFDSARYLSSFNWLHAETLYYLIDKFKLFQDQHFKIIQQGLILHGHQPVKNNSVYSYNQ